MLVRNLTSLIIFTGLMAWFFPAGALAEDPSAPPASIPDLLNLPAPSAQSIQPGLRPEEREFWKLWDRGEKRRARRILKQWRGTQKKSPRPWVVSAHMNFESGRYRRCLSDAGKAIKRSPQFSEAYYWRGRAYEAMGKPLEAANEYRAALLGRDAFEKAERAIHRVESLLEVPTDEASSEETPSEETHAEEAPSGLVKGK